jgi:hypothetical protein
MAAQKEARDGERAGTEGWEVSEARPVELFRRQDYSTRLTARGAARKLATKTLIGLGRPG